MSEKTNTEVMENVAEVVTENKEVIEKILTNGSSKKQVLIILASMFGTAIAIYIVGKMWNAIRDKASSTKDKDLINEDCTEEREPIEVVDGTDETEEK